MGRQHRTCYTLHLTEDVCVFVPSRVLACVRARVPESVCVRVPFMSLLLVLGTLYVLRHLRLSELIL